MGEKLKGCPFCGSAPDISRSQLAVSVGCDNNDCPARECHAAGPIADEAKIIAAWNTRAPADLRSALEAETIERCAKVAKDQEWSSPDIRDLHTDVERLRAHDLGGQRLRDLLQGAMDMLRAADREIAALAPTKGDAS